jgi:hypothetical protein
MKNYLIRKKNSIFVGNTSDMRTLVLLLLPFYLFAQEDGIYQKSKSSSKIPETFTTVEKVLQWQYVFNSDENDILKKLNLHPKLSVNEDGTGKIVRGKMIQRGLAIFAQDDFNADFLIEIKEGKYRVTVFNISFIPSMNINIGGVSTNENESSIESYVVKKKDGSIRTFGAIPSSLMALDLYFKDIFVPKKQTDNSDW